MIKSDIEFKMISILITSCKEPRTIGKAISSFLQQDIKEKYELIISAPDFATQNVVKEFSKKHKQIKLFKDAGKGKSSAINQVIPFLKGEIIILTDGDVFVSKTSVNELLKQFKNKKVGAVSGRPLSLNPRNNMFGFFSHYLLDAAHKLRNLRHKKAQFLECSGYLWAFRNKIIKKFPVDVAEDSIVPIMLWKKDYKIKYAENALVYVKYPDNLKDFVKQKIRAAVQSHEKLSNYTSYPKMKSFLHEIFYSYKTLLFPKSLKEFFWLFLLFPLRLYIWMLGFYRKYKGEKYTDEWKRIETTK